MKSNKLALVLLGLLLSISLFLHLYRFDLLPLYADETGQYQILKILTTPNQNIFSRIYDLLFYGPFSFTWLFGLNSLGVRLPSAIYGSITVLAIFLVAKSVSRKTSVALTAASLAAFLPWLFMISRIGHTSVSLLVLFVTLHVFFFVRSNKIIDYLTSLLFLGLATLHYPSMIIIAPLAFFLVSSYGYRQLSRKQKLYVVLLALPLVVVFFGFVSKRFRLFDQSGRALDLAIWRDVNTPYEIDKYRALSWNSTPSLFSFNLPPEKLANKLVYNRAMANVSIFTHNYLSFFSPDWLFLRGDAILRHSTGQVGEFYPFLAPFMLYGAFKFFQTKDKKTKLTFLVWILAAPIPAAITKDGAGYLLRVVTMLPLLTYFGALGLVESFNLVRKNWRLPYGVVLVLLGFFSAYYFFYGYFHVYPALSGRAYEYGFKELSDFQVSHGNASTLVLWDGYYHNVDFRFWQNTPLNQYASFPPKPTVIGETTFWQTFPNLYFSAVKSTTDLSQFIKTTKPRYIVLPDRYFYKYPEDIVKILSALPVTEIKYPDKSAALSIYTPK